MTRSSTAMASRNAKIARNECKRILDHKARAEGFLCIASREQRYANSH